MYATSKDRLRLVLYPASNFVVEVTDQKNDQLLLVRRVRDSNP